MRQLAISWSTKQTQNNGINTGKEPIIEFLVQNDSYFFALKKYS